MRTIDLWNRPRPRVRPKTERGFDTIHELFAELGRPTREALNALLPEPDATGEPPANHVPPPVDATTPRVVEWACVPLPGFPSDTLPIAVLMLFVVQPDGHQVEMWSARMMAADETEVREQLAELAEENAALWTGTTPDPSDVAELVHRVVREVTEGALAATGLGTDQAVAAYDGVRAAALQGVMTLLAHADERGWTGPEMAEGWRQYVNDLDAVPW